MKKYFPMVIFIEINIENNLLLLNFDKGRVIITILY